MTYQPTQVTEWKPGDIETDARIMIADYRETQEGGQTQQVVLMVWSAMHYAVLTTDRVCQVGNALANTQISEEDFQKELNFMVGNKFLRSYHKSGTWYYELNY